MGSADVSNMYGLNRYREFVKKADAQRLAYHVDRFVEGHPLGSKTDAILDPYDRDDVPPLHNLHRVMVSPPTLPFGAGPSYGTLQDVLDAKADPHPVTPAKTISRRPTPPPAGALPKKQMAKLRAQGAFGTVAEQLRWVDPPAKPTTGRSAAEAPPATGRSGLASAKSLRLSSSSPALLAAAPEDAECERAPTGALRAPTGSVRGPTGVSLRSRASHASRASAKSRISEIVQKEVRTALTDFLSKKQAEKERARAKNLAMPLHLRTGPDPIAMGALPKYSTTVSDALKIPVAMALDPVWSTDIKRINDRIGQRINYERRVSAATLGPPAPELPHMQPPLHLSNPPTPYWRPEVQGRWREGLPESFGWNEVHRAPCVG